MTAQVWPLPWGWGAHLIASREPVVWADGIANGNIVVIEASSECEMLPTGNGVVRHSYEPAPTRDAMDWPTARPALVECCSCFASVPVPDLLEAEEGVRLTNSASLTMASESLFFLWSLKSLWQSIMVWNRGQGGSPYNFGAVCYTLPPRPLT